VDLYVQRCRCYTDIQTSHASEEGIIGIEIISAIFSAREIGDLARKGCRTAHV
jgi:hypothetical protein